MSKSGETLDIGVQCVSCKIVDFLPIKCTYCHKSFCDKCIKTHQCEESKEELQKEKGSVQCPICSKYVLIKKGDNIDEVINKHISNGCKDEIKRQDEHKCSFCGKMDFVGIVCKDCHKSYCVEHRNQLAHHCPALERKPQSTQNSYLNSISSFLYGTPSPSKVESNAKTEQVIQPENERTLKVKKQAFITKNAVGSKNIPFNKRLYFELILPNEQRKALWIDKSWSCGKVIDVICSTFGLLNTNLANSPKYGLMTEKGEMVSISTTMNQLENYSTIIVLLV